MAPGVDAAPLPADQLVLLAGVDDNGTANQPADWTAAAGTWNGKAARFNAATGRVVFETARADILGGQVDASAGDPYGGVYFVSGPGGGTLSPTPTSVLYVANADGSSPHCLGCVDVQDGVDGVEIYKSSLSTGSPIPPIRQPGAVIHANRNKDLPFWEPSGAWIVAGIEMPRHGLSHAVGNSEVGGYVDLWAIAPDGKTWVQLTDFAATYTLVNPTSQRPLQCEEPACAAGCQAPPATNTHPFEIYACAAADAPPPAVGVMRPVISRSGKIAWSERVGWTDNLELATGKRLHYAWAGPLQIALGDLAFVTVGDKHLPAIGHYQRNLTPTPDAPAGADLWRAKDGNVIGRGYETWGFSLDDKRLLIASDAFLFSDKLGRSLPAWQAFDGGTQAFIDVTAWDYTAHTYEDLTVHDAAYAYDPNGSSVPAVADMGHWEEPVVFGAAPAPLIAFATSANLTPAWDPDSGAASGSTFALEVWVMPADRSAPAHSITQLSAGSAKFLTYPTDIDGDTLYITRAPQTGVASNAPGSVYRYKLGSL